MLNFLLSGLRNAASRGAQRLLGVVLMLTMVMGSVGSAWANTGIFEGYVVLTTGSNLNYYDLNPQTNTSLFDFNNSNLGTFPTAANGGNLNFSGGQLKTFKNSDCSFNKGDNVTGAVIHYVVYPTGARPSSPVFTAVNLPFDGNLSASDQRWTNQNNVTNLLAGRAPGNYTLEVFGSSAYNGCSTSGTNFYSDFGANYKATFSVGSLCGTVYTIDNTKAGSFTNYTSFSAAFEALTAFGVTCATTFVVQDGTTYTELAPPLGPIAGVSSGSQVTFVRSNPMGAAAARPRLLAPANAGTGALDGLVRLSGADFVTFNGLALADPNNAAATTAQQMEFGFALFRASATDGCQNNTFRNCSVGLNRANPATVGIYGSPGTTASPTDAPATAPAGANSNNPYSGNTVADAATGIFLAATATAAANLDQNNDIGTAAGNVVSSFGGADGASGIAAVQQAGLRIVGNTVSGSATGGPGASFGIALGAGTGGALVARNLVRTLKSVGTAGVGVRGISLDPGAGATGIIVRNNVVADLTADGGGATGTGPVMGIGVLSGAGAGLYHNSVQLNGDRANNAAVGKVAAALFVADGATGLNVRNNVLSNVQTTSDPDAAGTGTNYAVYAAGTANPFAIIDYNLYDPRSGATPARGVLAAAPEFVGHLGGTDRATLDAWKTATGQDRSSMATAAGRTAGFASALTLAPAPADPNAYALNSTGVQLPGLATDDFTGAARPTTLPAGAPDLGAYEFTPTVEPNPLEVTGTYAPGGTQLFFFNGRPVASITYGTAGTLPATLTARYSPGAVPPPPYTPATTPRFANVTYRFTDSGGGAGFSYTLVLNYEPALLGTILSEAAQRVSLRNAAGTGYGTYFGTLVSTAARTLDAQYPMTRFGLFAISDQSAPLPVELARFEAVREGADAALSWATASEKNNRGFAVEVSTGGEFRELAFVAGAGSSSAPRAYAFRDREAGKAGPRYYRLRQLDFDGTASFSPVRALAFGEGSGPSALSAAPNPFDGGFVLAVQTRTAQPGAVLTLFDATGRPVARRVLDVPAGRSQLPVADLEGLAAGLYVGQLTLEGQTLHLKVVKR